MALRVLDRWTSTLVCLLLLGSTHAPGPGSAVNIHIHSLKSASSIIPSYDLASPNFHISAATDSPAQVQSVSSSTDRSQQPASYSFSQLPLERLTRSVRKARYAGLDKSRASAFAKTLSEIVETPLPRDEFPESAVLQSLTQSITLKTDRGATYTVKNAVNVSRTWFYTIIEDIKGNRATARFPRVTVPEVNLEEFKMASADRRRFVGTLPRDLRSHALKSVAFGGLEFPSSSGQKGVQRTFIVVDAHGGVVNSAEIFSQALLSIMNLPLPMLTDEDRAYTATHLLYLMETLLGAPRLFPEINEHSFWISTEGRIYVSDLFNSVLEKNAIAEDVAPAKKNVGRAVAGVLFKLWCHEIPAASRKRPLERETSASVRRKMKRSFLETYPLKEKSSSELSLAPSESPTITSESAEESRRLSFASYPELAFEECKDTEIERAIRTLVESDDVNGATQAALSLFRAK